MTVHPRLGTSQTAIGWTQASKRTDHPCLSAQISLPDDYGCTRDIQELNVVFVWIREQWAQQTS